MGDYAVDPDAIEQARRRIAAHIHRTPVLTSRTLDARSGRRLFFKCENFQRAGAFKIRGALSAVMRLTDAQAARGVVTHSSGNHAQALALAASIRGITAHVVMPRTAPDVKQRAVKHYGAAVYLCDPTMTARRHEADRVVGQTGGVFISSYDHPDVIAGQGTVALELLEQVPDLDAIVAPVSGGGLVSGIAIAARTLRPDIRIIAAEPTGADDVARSLAAGERVVPDRPHSIADGLLATPGELTWPILRDLLSRVVTVSDTQIVAAMRLIWERMKLIIEPSAAAAVAAVLDDGFAPDNGINRVGVVLSGGNADLDRRYWPTERAEAH